MKISVMVVVALVLISSLVVLMVNPSGGNNGEMESERNEGNFLDFSLPETRAPGDLDWNGSFPYNLQALPLIGYDKFTSSYVGDINGDGAPDVILASYFSQNISIYLNHNGFINTTPDLVMDNGTYGQYNPTDVVIVGKLIAVACHEPSSTPVSNYEKIFLYNYSNLPNHITLNPPNIPSAATSIEISSLAVGNVSGDGEEDIIATFSVNSTSPDNGRIAIYEAPFSDNENPKQTLNAQNNISRVVVGDFNQDGRNDIAAISLFGNVIDVYYNGPSGFSQSPTLRINYNSTAYITLGDLNGDGFEDLVVSSFLTGNVSIYFSGALEDTPLNLTALPGVFALGIGDFNGDGANDIIASVLEKRTYAYGVPLNVPQYMLIFNSPVGSGQTPNRRIFAGYNVLDIFVDDFNGDGMADAYVGAYGSREDFPSSPYVLYQRDGYLKGISDISLYGGIYPTGVALADFNSDGFNDLLVAETGMKRLGLFINRAPGFVPQADDYIPIPANPLFIATGDLDGDGHPDFAVSHVSDGNVSVYLSSRDEMINLTARGFNSTYKVWIGDINIDGYPDVVVSSLKNRKIAIFNGSASGFNNGDVENITIDTYYPPNDFAIVNLSGETYPAIAVVSEGNLTIYTQDSQGFHIKQNITPESNVLLTGCEVGDFNKDGEDDLIVVGVYNNYPLSAYAVLIQDNGNFTDPAYRGYLPAGAYHMTSGDFNDDGYPDFAVTTIYPLATIGYFTGDDFVFDYLATNQNITGGIFSGDMNGDGKDDLVIPSHGPLVDNLPVEVDMVDIYYQKDYPPIANITGPDSVVEGNYINLSAENSTDTVSDRDSLNYSWYIYNESIDNWDLIGYGVNISYFAREQGNLSFILEVRDKEGLTDFAVKNVAVLDSSPVVNFTHTNTIEGQTTHFTADIDAYDGVYAIYWDMNSDGTWDFENVTEVDYTYLQNGTYNVNLTVIDGDGSLGYVNKTVFIEDTAPTCDFRYSPTVIYEGEVVNFTDESTAYDGIVEWIWDFGNAVVEGKNVSYIFDQQGNYLVNHTVVDSDGSRAWIMKTIVVMDTFPEVNFTYTGTYEGEEFVFTPKVESYDPISSYYWDFGDGNTSTKANPTHVYVTQGTYIVTLYVNDSDGSNVSYSRMITVEDRDPSVNFTYTQAIEGQTMQFEAQIDSYDGITSISWDFGDGSTSSDMNPQHIYIENGTYVVTVIVRESDGDEARASKTVYVQDTSPQVSLRVDGSGSVVEDADVILNASGTTAYDGIKQYLWDFNYRQGHFSADVTTSVPMVKTSYPEQGHYIIALMVVDGDGSASIATVTITVTNVAPVANFTFAINGTEVHFDASRTYDTPSDKELLNYTWDFGDGKVGYGINAVHRYSEPGRYTVTLTVVDNDGAVSRVSRVVVIKAVSPGGGAGGGFHEFPWFLILLLIATAIVAILFVLTRRKEKYVVDDVYLIHESGILIHHATRRLKPEMDEDILSSMLVAIQEFVKDAFKGEDNVSLKGMEFGDKRIQIHKGKHLYLAVVSNTTAPKKMEEKIRAILDEIEKKYENVLKSWDGDVQAFRGVGEILKKIWE